MTPETDNNILFRTDPRIVLSSVLRRPELLVFVAITLLLSAPAMSGGFSSMTIFLPDGVRQGEWWRLFTHPFVHVSRYHLLLDGAAFALLYLSLKEKSLFNRLAYVAAAGAGSLALSWAADSSVATHGLCGLSGIAHGLMAISAAEMIVGNVKSSPTCRLGWIVLAMVSGKALFEAFSGAAFLEFLHFGQMGAPVAISHAGGVAGGLLAWLRFRRRPIVTES